MITNSVVKPILAELKRLIAILDKLSPNELSPDDKKEMEALSKECLPRLRKILK